MDEEALLNFKRARSRKKGTYRVPFCTNEKIESPSRGKYSHAIKSSKSVGKYKLSPFCILYIILYL